MAGLGQQAVPFLTKLSDRGSARQGWRLRGTNSCWRAVAVKMIPTSPQAGEESELARADQGSKTLGSKRADPLHLASTCTGGPDADSAITVAYNCYLGA